MADDRGFRVEKDFLGEVKVPESALFGAQTQRAVDNFPVSGVRIPMSLIRALGIIKRAAAETNAELRTLDAKIAEAIARAAGEVAEGTHDAQFPVDVFQTGSGTSSHMNANEVIANRASILLGGQAGKKDPVHPNDHVNLGQSSNDVFPTAIHIATVLDCDLLLIPAMETLERAFVERAAAFDHVVKLGRTHLMDAVPVRLSQELFGYASQLRSARGRVERAREGLLELPLGGTAVGTGVGAPPGFAVRTIARIGATTGVPFRDPVDRFEAMASRDALVAYAAALRGVAISLTKIANDLRWMASGPASGLAEIRIPDLQPGSSIMPGKVNPVVLEMTLMVAAQVVGADTTVAWAGARGEFEINVMMPVIALNVLGPTELLSRAMNLLTEKVVRGLEANEERARSFVERSSAMVTALAPKLGYDRASEIAREAQATGKTVRAIVSERGLIPPAELDALLDARKLTGE
ncbi:MAG: class II fumarate hydratase [Polyangiaceae bacterium]|nr:class II fumarate hydratase [Polyangiaceae bacterium]